MTKRNAGEVTVGDYTLVMNLNTMCDIEDATGESFFVVAQRLLDGETISVRLVRTMLWAALRANIPDLTEEEAARIASEIGVLVAVEALGAAIKATMGGEAAKGRKPAAA